MTTLIVPGVQMFRYSEFWIVQMCSRPVALPPFFSISSQMLFQTGKKRGVSGHPPFLSSLEKHHLEQSETKKYHVEACGST